MAQNWNNLLSYIKGQLGSPTNAIEMTDAEIQTHISTIVMPDFSQYMGNNMLYVLRQSMRITMEGSGNAFRLPIVKDSGVEITRVVNLYQSSGGSGITEMLNAATSLSINPGSLLINTVYADVLAYLSPIRSYLFNKPDIIITTAPLLNDVILDLDVIHTNPNTIPGDLYHKSFKKMCLLSIIENIVAIRSKFANVQTPLGEVALNIDFLNTKADRLRDEIKEVNNDIPPDPLIEFVI